jgi:hypothetical protein
LTVFAAAKESQDPNLQEQAENLNEKLKDELNTNDALGIAASLVKVPIDNSRYVGLMNRKVDNEHFFQIYDVVKGHPVRRFTHPYQADNAFHMSPDAQWLCRVEEKDLEFKVAILPQIESVQKVLRMQYKSTSQDNYGNACKGKQKFKDRIYRDLHVYHMYQEESKDIVQKMSNGVTQEQNMQLMCLKYDQAIEDPFKLKANREFLFMQKIILN